MACKSCAERRIRMKQWIAKQLGVEFVDANPPANFQPEQAERASTQTKGSGQAGEAGTLDGKQDMATTEGTGADSGRVQMPSVRKTRNRTTGTR